MKLKNFLIVVKDIEKAKDFYHELFGLNVVKDFDGNIILTDGLVLQEKKIWDELINKESANGDADAELYFVENNLDIFLEKLEKYDKKHPDTIKYLNRPMTHSWGQRVVRFYDLDGHVIEVGEPFDGEPKCYCDVVKDADEGTGSSGEGCDFFGSEVVCGAEYEHYKGKRYKVLGVATHSETLEEMVVYQALYGEFGIWVRPKDMFLETVEVKGEKVSRFRRIE